MSNERMIQLLNEANYEIRQLRRSNETMAAKLDVYETFKRMVMGTPQHQGMSPDVCFEIENAIRRLEEEDYPRPSHE